jgi:hypothetical protein
VGGGEGEEDEEESKTGEVPSVLIYHHVMKTFGRAKL